MIGRAFQLPEEQRRARNKAKRLSWLSIVLLTIAGMLLVLAVGQSEAMKTAWVSDILTAIPPMALLVAMRYELREPTRRFPHGYMRAISVAFLVTSGVLSIIGLYLLVESVMKLLRKQHPSIGMMELFGHQLWAGWVMIAALTFSLSCGLVLGLLKKPVAKQLNDKALSAEATMNRDEWMSEGAAIVGLLLVAFGHWWADAAAAAFISVEIVHDGWINMRLVIADLMDEAPSVLGKHDIEDTGKEVREAVTKVSGVNSAAVRLREHGRAVTGEVFVVLEGEGGEDRTTSRIAEIANAARGVDWRLHDIVVMPVKSLSATEPPQVDD
jgi:cation diffusion facilitator family transporter